MRTGTSDYAESDIHHIGEARLTLLGRAGLAP